MQISFTGLVMSENSIVFTHVDEARKANLHGYKRIRIRPAIYERGLYSCPSIALVHIVIAVGGMTGGCVHRLA